MLIYNCQNLNAPTTLPRQGSQIVYMSAVDNDDVEHDETILRRNKYRLRSDTHTIFLPHREISRGRLGTAFCEIF